MKRLIATLAGATLLVLMASCSGETSQEEPPEDVEALVEQALATMDGLNSYRLEMGFDAQNPPIVIEFAAPDSYRSQMNIVRATDGAESVEGVYESIVAGGKSYTRECEGVDQGCGDWREGIAPPVASFGPSPTFLPQWPLVALEMAQNPQALGSEEMAGDSLLHLRGSVNHIRAIFENERRVFTAAGVTSFSEECELEAAVPVSGTPIEGQEVCRELTFEETLEQQEPTLSFYNDNPSTIDVWLSPDDFLVRRIELTIPPHDQAEPPGQETSVLLLYSRFNQVTIEPPR